MSQGSQGYQSNKNVRTRSNGRRARHGYSYWLELVRCIELNREMQRRRKKATDDMYGTPLQAFAAARTRKGKKT